jgi:hypothetical protein
VNNFDASPQAGLWGPKREEAPEGKWADLALDLSTVFTPVNAAKVLSVKSSNHAFRYYKGAPNILEAAPATPTNDDPNIYIPASSDIEWPIKWKIYNTNTFAADATHNWGILLWSAAPQKVITVEIFEHGTYTDHAADATGVTKIVIDYSGVNIQ